MAHVTVPEQPSRRIYEVTTSQDTFTFPFTFYEDSDIEVYDKDVSETVPLSSSLYTVNGNAGSDEGYEGGNVVLNTGVTNTTVIVRLNIPIKRTSDHKNSSEFNITELNTQTDKQVSMLQKLESLLKRSLKLRVTSELVDGSGNELDLTFLEDPEESKVFIYDATQKGFVNGPATTDIASVAASIDNVDLIALYIANVNNVGNSISDVNALAAVADDIPVLAAIPADISQVADDSDDIQLLADLQDGTVATGALSTLAGLDTEMVALAAISANITATAGAITNINAVGADLLGDDDIGTCATNIAAINDVADALAAAVATGISYSNGSSGLSSTNVQDAIDEVVTLIESLAGDDVAYDNGTSGLTATDVQAAIDEVLGMIGGGGGNSTVFHATFSSAITVNSATWTRLAYDQETFDPDNLYNTSNGRFTPDEEGYYLVFASCTLSDGAAAFDESADIYIGSIFKNETSLGNNARVSYANGKRHTGGGGQEDIVQTMALVYLNGTTDYVTAGVYQDTGSNLSVSENVSTIVGGIGSEFWAAKVG